MQHIIYCIFYAVWRKNKYSGLSLNKISTMGRVDTVRHRFSSNLVRMTGLVSYSTKKKFLDFCPPVFPLSWFFRQKSHISVFFSEIINYMQCDEMWRDKLLYHVVPWNISHTFEIKIFARSRPIKIFFIVNGWSQNQFFYYLKMNHSVKLT